MLGRIRARASALVVWTVAVAALAPGARAAEMALPADADGDTSLLRVLPHGAASTIAASSLGSGYVRFAVPRLSTTLLRARLRLTVDRSDSGTISAQATDPAWSESSLTYVRAPRRIGSTLASAAIPAAGSVVDLDVTGAVTSGAPVSFAIDHSALSAVRLAARESGRGAQLILSLASAAQDELTRILAHPGEGGGAAYALRDDHGTSLDALDITQQADPGPCNAAGIGTPAAPAGAPCYLGVSHTWLGGDHFVVRLAASRDLIQWRHVRDLQDDGSQPTLATLPDGSMLLALEQTDRDAAGARTGSHVRVLHWPSGAALMAAGGPPDAAFDAPRQLSALNEGTPDLVSTSWGGTLQASTFQLGLHWYDGRIDRQGAATLSGLGGSAPTWTARRDDALDSALRVAGALGNRGDRSQLAFGGRTLIVSEGQGKRGDFGSWSLYVLDPAEATAERIPIATPGGSASFGNPSVTRVTLPDGRPGIVATAFCFSERSGGGEAGEVLFWRAL